MCLMSAFYHYRVALEDSVQCGTVICIISVPMRLMREKQSHHIRVLSRLCGGGIYSETINTFKKNSVADLQRSMLFAGVNFLTSRTRASFFS